LVVLWR